MNPTIVPRAVVVALACALATLAVSGATKSKAPPHPTITKLAWLAGSWRMEKGGRVIDEQWMVPGAGVMPGMQRTIIRGRLADQQFLQIREGPGGDVFYVAQVNGQKEAVLQLTSLADNAVVFENPVEDFPRKITYTLQADGALLVVVEGQAPDGQDKAAELLFQPFKR
jgi:hypothetical protein